MNRNNLGRDPHADYQRLRDAAIAESEALRRQAIGDFWRGADQVLATATTAARRSAERLLQRLRRRHAAGA